MIKINKKGMYYIYNGSEYYCKILDRDNQFILIYEYEFRENYIIGIGSIKHITLLDNDKIEEIKDELYEDAIKDIEKNTPPLTKEEKEKRRGWLSIYTDKQGALSIT